MKVTSRLKELPKGAVMLGKGVFTWDRAERVSDRYGYVYLMVEGNSSFGGDGGTIPLTKHRAMKGRLIVRVEETRQSTHIGDGFRGVGPRTPEKGEIIVLGEGTLDYERNYDGGPCVGLIPTSLRTSDWLDIRSLYDCHEQTVTLFFAPCGRTK